MTITLPSTMKAVEAAAAGPISNMKVVATRPVPSLPAAGEEPAVIVEVHSAALNPIDWKMIELDLFVQSWPHALGCDVSGTVVAASEGAAVKEGDKVWAFTLIGPPHASSLAEYVRVPASMVGRVPEGVSMEAASTLGLCYLTAAFGLYKEMGLPTTAPAESCPVLVYGASSTVGVFALSLLKAAGYRAIAVASAQHHAWLKDTLGAAQAVDYHNADWPDAIAAVPENAGMRFAIDCIGVPDIIDTTLEKCGAAGAGTIATVDPMTRLGGKGKSELLPINIGPVQSGKELEEAGRYVKLIDGLLADGRLATMPTKVLGGLEEAVRRLEMLKQPGKVRGEKLVVTV